MRKTINLSQEQYNLIDHAFDKFPNGMYLTYGELIVELIKAYDEYQKIKDGVN